MPVLVALALLLFVGSASAQPIAPNDIEVTDGDTIVTGGHTYRLVGCDTPEFSSRQRKVPGKRLALLAAERLQELIAAHVLEVLELALDQGALRAARRRGRRV
jgi:endonuclease YncB( thermonuclease family)